MLAEIGGDQAEATIGELLSTTGRGFEIAYAGKIIQSWLGKDAYRTEVLAAAHELLLDPVEAVGGNQFDRLSRNYLLHGAGHERRPNIHSVRTEHVH